MSQILSTCCKAKPNALGAFRIDDEDPWQGFCSRCAEPCQFLPAEEAPKEEPQKQTASPPEYNQNAYNEGYKAGWKACGEKVMRYLKEQG